MSKKINETTFALSNGRRIVIVHDLPMKGPINSIDAALDNWLARTNLFTAESFCKYILKKMPYALAMPKTEWDKRVKAMQP